MIARRIVSSLNSRYKSLHSECNDNKWENLGQKVIKGMGFSLRLCLRGAGLVEWYRARLYAGVR